MKYILLFEKFTESETQTEAKPLSKRELKRLKYSKVLTNKVVTYDELDEYGIPEEIKKEMATWEVINKSPYSNSFYSSLEVGWNSKPNGSYRVSDHWNFYTREKWHCQTDKKVPNNSHISLAKYDQNIGRYIILMSLPTDEQKERLSKNEIRLKHLKDPETIWKKKQFKDKIRNREVIIDLTYNGIDYHGVVNKYTGSELKIDDEIGNSIFSENSMETIKTGNLKLTDRQGNEVGDPIQWVTR